MSGSILQRYAGDRHSSAVSEEQDAAGANDLGAFGWLRGFRDRAVMLELRKKTGSVLAVEYGGMEIEFDPSEGITILTMSGRKVRIKGSNLNVEARPQVRLFEGLTRHRVSWIQEADQPTGLLADASATVIESIEW
jgi:hypothetical protein